uniref:Uncharacterized protein n=1 Tax=Vespula pensylvanica TaxID=30213 RepID=A0A834PDI9_VESPE|nr:hypothetical protein H0235_004139 [Vespula pensylvanica]
MVKGRKVRVSTTGLVVVVRAISLGHGSRGIDAEPEVTRSVERCFALTTSKVWIPPALELPESSLTFRSWLSPFRDHIKELLRLYIALPRGAITANAKVPSPLFPFFQKGKEEGKEDLLKSTPWSTRNSKGRSLSNKLVENDSRAVKRALGEKRSVAIGAPSDGPPTLPASKPTLRRRDAADDVAAKTLALTQINDINREIDAVIVPIGISGWDTSFDETLSSGPNGTFSSTIVRLNKVTFEGKR